MSEPSEFASTAEATYRFATVPEWVLDHRELTGNDVRLFGVLARYDGRRCIPGITTLAKRLVTSPDTIRRSMVRLVAVGAVHVEPRFVDGRQTSNLYVLAGDVPLKGGVATVQGGGRTDAGDGGRNRAGDGGRTDARAEREQEEREQEERERECLSSPSAPPDPPPSTELAVVARHQPPERTKRIGGDAERLCAVMSAQLVARGHRNTRPSTRWVTDMDRLLRIDGRTVDEVERVLRWLDAGADDTAAFWRTNILSPAKLRSKWDQMREQHARRPVSKAQQRLDETAAHLAPYLNGTVELGEHDWSFLDAPRLENH